MNKSKVEKIDFYSNILKKKMSLLVYLPESYDDLIVLPVLYFLHGRSGNENIMFEAGINSKADVMIKNKEIKPMIIVCPSIENSRGINSSLICESINNIFNNTVINLGMYEDYFIKEVVPLIDRSFNTIKSREGRYVGGASAGGYSALHNAFRHLDMFSKVGGHMPVLESELDDEDKIYYKNISIWEKYSPVYILEGKSKDLDLEVYLDAGDKDEGEFYKGCLELYKLLGEKGITSQNHVFKGQHNIQYIQSNIEKYLKFYGKY